MGMKDFETTSLLRDSVTRDMEVCEHKGKYYYTISQEQKIIHTSELYKTSEEAAREGVYMLDRLHEQSPLLSDYNPEA